MTQKECNIDKIIEALTNLEKELSSKEKSQQEEATSKEAPVNDNESTSLCDWIRGSVKKIGKAASNHASEGSQGGSKRKGQEDPYLEIRKLQSDIRQMKAAFENFSVFQTNMKQKLERDLPKLSAILNTDPTRPRYHELKEIRRKVFNLKCEIPSLLYKQSSRGLSVTDSQTAEENGEIGRDIYLPSLHVSEDFKHSPAFEDILEKFEQLGFTQKLCLLSFAVFPENREIKRTMLMYWWIGEEFIDCDNSENLVMKILDDFSTKGLLEPVEDETKLKPNSYKMEPHVHSAVVHLAASMGLFNLYSSEGMLSMEKSSRHKVCLVKGSSLVRAAKTSVMKPEALQTIFNSSERYPDFTFKWFPLMNSLKVLYLGRWEQTAKRHIEVESTKFLKDINSLKNLRLASFKGISRIEKLENNICKLRNLVILDLKACYNLEGLPEDIGLLESLIYLDVSECYMLDRMPKGIEDLSKLQVLKGFVISQSDDERNCAVKNLVNLRKLSITVNKRSFKVESLMESLSGLEKLESLKIAWGAQFGDKEAEANLEEGKKHDEVKTESSKSDKVAEGEKKTTETIQNKPDDQKGKDKVEEGGDGDKGKADLEERKKQDEVEAEKSKSDKVVEGEKKASPPGESSDMIQKKPDDDKSKVEKEGDGDKEKADLDEGKKRDEVEAERSKSDKVVKGDEKTSPPQESKDKIQSKPDDKSKVETEGDGDKGKADPEEGNKVETESSKSDNGVEGVKKANPSRESTDAIQNKPDDHQRGDKQEEKGDGEKEKVNLDEGKKTDEVKAESSKPDKVIEGDEKTSPPKDSIDTMQSKPDDHREISKVQEKGDGEKKGDALKKLDGIEAKTQKSDKTTKLCKKVCYSENKEALIQEKPDDLKRDNAMGGESHETPSPSKPPKESGLSKSKLLRAAKNFVGVRQQKTPIDTSKLLSSLKKLELECFPDENPPIWLNPKSLKNLEKLSIKGGKLSRITDERPTAENQWKVQILRLKYLHKFKVEWRDLKALFPNMILLEKYECPKIAFCPTDGNGVWRS